MNIITNTHIGGTQPWGVHFVRGFLGFIFGLGVVVVVVLLLFVFGSGKLKKDIRRLLIVLN